MRQLSYTPLYCEASGCPDTRHVGSLFCKQHTPPDPRYHTRCYTDGCANFIRFGSSRYCLPCSSERFGCRFCGSLNLHPSISQWMRHKPGTAEAKQLYCRNLECVLRQRLETSLNLTSLYGQWCETFTSRGYWRAARYSERHSLAHAIQAIVAFALVVSWNEEPCRL